MLFTGYPRKPECSAIKEMPCVLSISLFTAKKQKTKTN